jgi:hypothetical protein
MQYADGGQASMMPPDFSAPTVGTVMGTAPAPTTGQTLESIRQQALSLQNQLQSGQVTGLTPKFYAPVPTGELGTEGTYTPLTPEEERAIQRAQMKLFQKEIDATNQIYDQMVLRAQTEGQGRLGSAASMGARAGILGSDFQGATESNIQGETRGIVGGLNAERTAKVQAIMGKGRQAAVDEIAAKNKARKEGADAYIKFMAEKDARKTKNMGALTQALIAQGIDPQTLPEEELTSIATSYGTTKDDIFANYSTAKALAEQEAGDGTFTLGEGQARYDAQGNVIASRAKTYAPKDSDGNGTTDTKLTSTNKKKLLGGGWTEADIATLEDGVRTEGLPAVIKAEKDAGATDAQIRALEEAYGVEGGAAATSLSRENLAKFYNLTDDSTQSSFLGFEYGETNKEKLDTLVSFVERYKAVGYTDEQILKLMQEGQ